MVFMISLKKTKSVMNLFSTKSVSMIFFEANLFINTLLIQFLKRNPNIKMDTTINNSLMSIKSNGEIVMQIIAKMNKPVTLTNIIQEISNFRQV